MSLESLEPHAQRAANRWVAWANWLSACLSVHMGAAERALGRLADAEVLFEAEGLEDGVIDVLTVRLTALRLGRSDDETYVEALELLKARLDIARPGGRRYARAHRFTDEAVALEEAEFARFHTQDLAVARERLEFAAASHYKIHRAMGLLGLSGLALGEAPELAIQLAFEAKELADEIDARLLQAHADAVLRGAASAGPAVASERFIP